METLRFEKGELHKQIMELYTQGYNVTEISNIINMSRYKVDKIIKQSIKFLKKLIGEKNGKKNKSIQKKVRS